MNQLNAKAAETVREIEVKSQLLLRIITTLVEEVGLRERLGDFSGALALVPTINETLQLFQAHLGLLMLYPDEAVVLLRYQVIERITAELDKLQVSLDKVQAQVDQRTAVYS